MRTIGLVVVSTSINDFTMILKSIFTTALNESDGINENLEPTACENAKKYLRQRIATHIIETDFNNEQLDDLRKEEITDHALSNTSIFYDINHIFDECEQMSKLTSNSTGDHDNMQYLPTLEKKLLDFCKHITCWSAIMVPIFGYGNLTESSVTSEFVCLRI